MRFEKTWIIVRKEFSEFRRNKYIIYSLVLMPVIMAVVLPIVYLVPTASFATPPADHPLELNIHILAETEHIEFNNTTFANIRFVHCDLRDCIAFRCEFQECNLTYVLVRDSNLTSVTAKSSNVLHCNIWTSTIISSNTQGSLFLGQESQSEYFLKILINSLLMFFILIPSIIPTVIASYSFVGEKLNRSLEPLLATPTTDLELLLGKALAIFIPATLVTWLSLVPTIVIVDVVTSPILGYNILPNYVWLVGVFLVAPLVCILSVLFNVIVSAKVSDVRTSQQIGSIVILPIIAFFMIGLAGFITLNLENMALFGLAVLCLDALVFVLATRAFEREKILVNWK